MIKPTYPTRPMTPKPVQPDVASHEDIDWRTITVAEAIDADRARHDAMRAKLAALRKPSRWDTFLQMIGVRRVRV